MTTILGIKTNYEKEGIVIAADKQLSLYDKEEKLIAKKPFLKIIHGENWAMTQTGTLNPHINNFYNKLSGLKKYGSSEEKVKEIISRAIRECRFMEINELNAMLYREGTSFEDLHNFILAVNNPLGLWKIDDFGNLIEPQKEKYFEYICLGSGEERVERDIKILIEEDEGVNPSKIDIPISIKIATHSLGRAEHDAYTSGLDLLVLTPDNIKYYGDKIMRAVSEAQKKVIEEIANEYQ